MESINDRQSVITSRVRDFLVHRAAQNRGLVVLNNREIIFVLELRFPCDPRPTKRQVEKALRILRQRNVIRRGSPRGVVRIVAPGP